MNTPSKKNLLPRGVVARVTDTESFSVETSVESEENFGGRSTPRADGRTDGQTYKQTSKRQINNLQDRRTDGRAPRGHCAVQG